MTSVTTKPEATQPSTETSSHLFDDWFDPIEAGIRDRVREFIEEMIRGELDAALSRPRYRRRVRSADGAENASGVVGHRHGSRTRSLTGTFGKTEITVPRARLATANTTCSKLRPATSRVRALWKPLGFRSISTTRRSSRSGFISTRPTRTYFTM